MNVLITGGAGYIGSHAVKQVLDAGHAVVVVDNLFRGHRAAVDGRGVFYEMDLAETEKLEGVMREHGIECVMHFAALAYVGESVDEPLWYYRNNTAGTMSLVEAMRGAKVNKLVFSSTCATYGEPEVMPIVETMGQCPINPYGWSKLFVERILLDYAASNPEFGFTALRYFNVAGCDPSGAIGEDHRPETHLIPIVLEVALGKRESVTVFGEDYPTPDGTCVRDYVHVCDLIRAHVLAMGKIEPGGVGFYNLGIGHGYSVREVIDSVGRVSGCEIEVKMGARRAGDPPELYANADKAREELGWTPEFTEIDDVVETAWRWFKDHPGGYGG